MLLLALVELVLELVVELLVYGFEYLLYSYTIYSLANKKKTLKYRIINSITKGNFFKLIQTTKVDNIWF